MQLHCILFYHVGLWLSLLCRRIFYMFQNMVPYWKRIIRRTGPFVEGRLDWLEYVLRWGSATNAPLSQSKEFSAYEGNIINMIFTKMMNVCLLTNYLSNFVMVGKHMPAQYESILEILKYSIYCSYGTYIGRFLNFRQLSIQDVMSRKSSHVTLTRIFFFAWKQFINAKMYSYFDLFAFPDKLHNVFEVLWIANISLYYSTHSY